jgi:hypothetical protein
MSPETTTDQWLVGPLKCSFDVSGVQQAESDVQRLAKASVGIIVNFAGVHDSADPQQPLRPAGAREARIIIGQEAVESGNDTAQEYGLRRFIHWMNEG